MLGQIMQFVKLHSWSIFGAIGTKICIGCYTYHLWREYPNWVDQRAKQEPINSNPIDDFVFQQYTNFTNPGMNGVFNGTAEVSQLDPIEQYNAVKQYGPNLFMLQHLDNNIIKRLLDEKYIKINANANSVYPISSFDDDIYIHYNMKNFKQYFNLYR